MPTPLSTVDILHKLIGFDTTSRNSNLDLIAWIEAYLLDFGIQSERIGEADKANLVATIGPSAVPGYVLSGHTDVVPVDGQDWQSDPFDGSVRDGRLYGRGAADMKGFIASVLSRVPTMAAMPLTTPLHLLFSYDEEVGCLGVRSALRALADWPVRPAGCIVGEPTGMDVVIGHKAKRSVRVSVQGTSAHSSLAPRAVNAVEYAARLIVFISDLGRALARDGARDTLYDIEHTTAHVGVVRGGTQLNIVPDGCTFDFEFRSVAEDNPDALTARIVDYAREVLEPEMRAVSPTARITFEALSAIEGLETSPADEIVALVKSLAGRNGHAKVAFATEGGLFRTMADIPTVVCGPGHIAQAHKPDEYVDLTQLNRCDAFLDRLITHCST